MQEKRFYREDYPLDILAEFGLTEQMIYDLPDYVHETIEMGGKSPLLPISIEQPFGLTHGFAKFSLVETEHGVDVMFYPKLKNIDLDQFSEYEKKLLLEGKVIVSDIAEPSSEDGSMVLQRIKAFVQIDKDTNDVLYTPTQVIGRNLTAISNEYDLTGEQLQSFWSGELVTVMDFNEQGDEEPVTIGVDLFTDKGVIVVPGSAEQWEKTVRRTMPEYSFGNDGCWVNRNGQLRYVPEEEFTKDIYAVLQRNARSVEVPEVTEPQMQSTQEFAHQMEREESRQFSR